MAFWRAGRQRHFNLRPPTPRSGVVFSLPRLSTPSPGELETGTPRHWASFETSPDGAGNKEVGIADSHEAALAKGILAGESGPMHRPGP